MTVAFNVRIPLPWKTTTFWKDGRKEWAHYDLATIWHVDPEKDGTDDSCGWFKRARHGDPEVLGKIIKAFEFDWDRTFEQSKQDHDSEDGDFVPHVYYCGFFKTSGDPYLSVGAIVLNLFLIAANEHFKCDGHTNWKRSKKFLRKNLLDILLFAENPHDSLFDGITRKFEKGCGEEYGTRARQERISKMAGCIYAWILRAEQPWYRHARWHIHHWKIDVHPVARLWRFITRRCCKCGSRFGWNESPIGDWNGTRVWHQHCEENKPTPCPQTQATKIP